MSATRRVDRDPVDARSLLRFPVFPVVSQTEAMPSAHVTAAPLASIPVGPYRKEVAGAEQAARLC